MRISILTVGAIASILTINSVLADTVVTSRNYVDTQDALKQDKITAGTTGSVVTYNGAQNGQTQFSERGIFDPETDWDDENEEIVSGHEGDLLEAGSIFPDLAKMDLMIKGMGNALRGPAGNVITYNENGVAGGERGIYDGSTTYYSSTDADKLVTAGATRPNLNGVYNVTSRVCTQWIAGQQQTDANCLLWNLIPININYQLCTNNSDCASGCCVSGICGDCPM